METEDRYDRGASAGKGRAVRLMALLTACGLFLSGCTGGDQPASPGITLPPVPITGTIPFNDVEQSYRQTVLLYLPSLDGTRLVAVPEEAELSVSTHSAQRLCEMLLDHPGTDTVSALGGGTPLSLSGTEPVEVSGNVATISLAASALRLSYEELFIVGQALANTLCQFGDLQYVNVLVSGAQPGLDVAGALPAGCFQPNTREALGTLWARASAPKTTVRRAIAAALYYPAAGGKGMLCEGRILSFASLSPEDMIRTLLEALSAGAETLQNAPRCPALTELLLEDPIVTQVNGEKRAILRFDAALNARVIDAGITRSVMMASLVYTIATFLPGLDGVEIWIGGERISSLTPTGTFLSAGETITFEDGLMKRSDFLPFLLAPCVLYLADDGNLRAVSRPVPFYEAGNVRAILNQLMLGPQAYDGVSGLKAVLPEGLRDADLLGVSYAGGALRLNFSNRLIELAQSMSAAEERLMVYAMVDTLCRLPGVNRVNFLIMGEQPETFAGAVFLPGDFLPNLELIK